MAESVVSCTLEEGFALCVYCGTYNVGGLVDGARRAMCYCEEQRQSSLLFDARAAQGMLTIADCFEFTRTVSSFWNFSIRVAFLARVEQTYPDRFGESAAVVRGICVKVFNDYAEAVAWLVE